MLVPQGCPGSQISPIGLDSFMGTWTIVLVAAQLNVGVLPYWVEHGYDLNTTHTRAFFGRIKLVCLPELHESNLPAEGCRCNRCAQCRFNEKNSSLWVFYTIPERGRVSGSRQISTSFCSTVTLAPVEIRTVLEKGSFLQSQTNWSTTPDHAFLPVPWVFCGDSVQYQQYWELQKSFINIILRAGV